MVIDASDPTSQEFCFKLPVLDGELSKLSGPQLILEADRQSGVRSTFEKFLVYQYASECHDDFRMSIIETKFGIFSILTFM